MTSLVNARAENLKSRRPVCAYPNCPSHSSNKHHITIHSRLKGRIRYCCNICGRTFTVCNEDNNNILSGKNCKTINYAMWLHRNNYSTSEISFRVGVSKRTIFRWIKKYASEESNKIRKKIGKIEA